MKAKMLVQNCDRCGRELPLGATKYRAYVEITSEWDGFLPDVDGDEEVNVADLIEKASRLDDAALEEQVHMEANLLLCPQCRKEILASLRGGGDGAQNVAKKSAARLQ
jgi:hypothetical protein